MVKTQDESERTNQKENQKVDNAMEVLYAFEGELSGGFVSMRDTILGFIKWAAALAVLCSICGRAQGPSGEITGTVTDSTGAVVAGATITVTNPATNTQRLVKTNSDGIYDLPALPPGNYSLKVEMQGFGSQLRNDIELQVAQVARIDIALKVGNVSEVVEVTGARRCSKPTVPLSAP